MTLTNEQMKSGRYLKLALGRKLYRRMNACWDNGGFVRIGTATRYTDLKPKHRDLVWIGKSGQVYLKRGRNSDCIFTGIAGFGCSFQFTA